jgi:hypothetical protein
MINAMTPDSVALLTTLKVLIKSNHIKSWEVDTQGDFCHQAAQVKGVCYFKPTTGTGVLHFECKFYKDVPPTAEARAELHGHGVRLFMIHGQSVTSIQIPDP